MNLSQSCSGNLQFNGDIDIANKVRFKSRLFYLNNHRIILAPYAFLQNENESNRFRDTAYGTVSIVINFSSAAINPVILGLVFIGFLLG